MDELSQVHEQHGSLVWTTVYRILADHAEALDCCQDVFAEVLQRAAIGQVRDWTAFLRWLSTRRALDRLRRHRVESAIFESSGDIEGVSTAKQGPDIQAIWNELVQRLKQELTLLPEAQAEAFWLKSIEQMSYEEIAEQMGVDANHVGVLVHRARLVLRRSLADLNPLKTDDC